ncbi:DUF5107 domain-containing protein [Streptomyces longispororuber]|uniref:DUF5107 domain-containing protein n=1 Tax=Streptomyces longispororuber TaxID=68230 RepID=UPI0036F6DC11
MVDDADPRRAPVATTVRRDVLTLPAAPLGPDNPLPPLRLPRGPQGPYRIDERTRRELPRGMARQLAYEPLRSVLPAPLRDGYGRTREPASFDTLVLENDRLRATVLPGLGGRVHSLLHKPAGRELLYRNPVFQPAAFALNGAWFAGGIEWNIGATGHTTLSCAPLHAAVVTAPDGGPMLRLWEWERLRDVPFQVDLWLPHDSDFLHVGVRIRNPHEKPVPVYWWSSAAVPEERRVLAPAAAAWRLDRTRCLTRVPVPEPHGAYAADYFYDVPDGERRWIAAVDADGHGLVQTSTDVLRGRKQFVWGTGEGGRRWQEWLTGPGAGGYAEIQAGLARTQLEHVRLDGDGEVAWLEAYGPLTLPDGAAGGDDRSAAWAGARARLAEALPPEAVDAAYERWRPYADAEPGEVLATGSGWGALEVVRGGYDLPGTPFPEATLGPEQEPWLELWRSGAVPEPDPGGVPGPTLVARHWRDMLETAPARPHAEYHLGVAQWHAGDRAQAVRSWERGLERAACRWPLLRCLAVADLETGHGERAADRYAEAFDDLGEHAGEHADADVVAALGREALEALLAVGRAEAARAVWERLDPRTRGRGRFRLLEARLLLAEGDGPGARRVFEDGFEVADLREGDETLSEVWAAAAPGEPLPSRYDFRMRPPT